MNESKENETEEKNESPPVVSIVSIFSKIIEVRLNLMLRLKYLRLPLHLIFDLLSFIFILWMTDGIGWPTIICGVYLLQL